MGRKTFTSAVLTSADMNKYAEYNYGSYSGTTDGSNNLVVTHSAGYTPTGVFVQTVSPSGGANQGYPVVTAISSSTFTIRYMNTAGSMATVAVSGYFMTVP